MKQKLFTLLTLALFFCSGAWADETYYLQTPGAATPALTGDFYTTATLDQSQSCTYDEVGYSKAIKLGGSVTSASSNNYPDRMIRYDCKTTQTEFTFVVYNTKTSAYKYYISSVKENTLGSANTVSDFTSYDASGTKGVYYNTTAYSVTCTSATRASVYFTVGNNNLYVVQIIATEKGTALSAPGTAGYSVNFNKGRVVGRGGGDAVSLDDFLEFKLKDNYAAGNSTAAKIYTKGTDYIKFTVASPMVLSFTTSSTNQYNVSTTKGSDTDKVSPTADVAKKFNLTAGTYYINPQGSNVTPTGLSFSAAPVVTYNNNGGSGSMANSYFTVSACTFTAPTGQEFKEWNTSADGEGDKVEVGADVESNTDLYAIWYTPAVKHSVTYDLNGGTGTIPTQADVEEGQKFTVASGTTGITAPDGQRFKTWNDGTNDYAPGDDYTMGSSNVTLTAQWENIYAIAEGTHTNGYITIDKTVAAEGETITLISTPKPGYSLDSWSITKTEDGSATGITVTSNQFAMPAYAVTVNAAFTRTDTKKQILYLRNSADENDDLYNAIKDNVNYTVTYQAPGSQIVEDYELVILHESLTGSAAASGILKDVATANVPILNTKSYFYSDGKTNDNRWAWGLPNAGSSEVTGATLNTAISNVEDHPIFDGVTITSGVVNIINTAAAKAMQPVGSYTSGKEGYILATTPNVTSGSGAAIQELTPAQRGATSGKYLMISVSNAKLQDLSANGVKLFENAISYLLSDDTFTPTATVTTNKGKWASFTPGFNSTLASGAKAYIITDVTDDVITATPVSVLKAGTGYFVKGESASTGYAATPTNTPHDAITGNMIVGCSAATVISGSVPSSKYKYVLGTTSEGNSGLFLVDSEVTVGTGKAYLQTEETSGAHTLSLDFEEGGATGIQTVEAKKELLDGDFYNLKGQRVAQPSKGLYIINGRKVVIR